MSETTMHKITYQEAKDYLRKFNREHIVECKGVNKDRIAQIVIVMTEDTFTEVYPLEARSYLVSNDNKAFIDGMGGYSIYANSLDNTDRGVRLERYLEDEGNLGGWKIEYCYIKD